MGPLRDLTTRALVPKNVNDQTPMTTAYFIWWQMGTHTPSSTPPILYGCRWVPIPPALHRLFYMVAHDWPLMPPILDYSRLWLIMDTHYFFRLSCSLVRETFKCCVFIMFSCLVTGIYTWNFSPAALFWDRLFLSKLPWCRLILDPTHHPYTHPPQRRFCKISRKVPLCHLPQFRATFRSKTLDIVTASTDPVIFMQPHTRR